MRAASPEARGKRIGGLPMFDDRQWRHVAKAVIAALAVSGCNLTPVANPSDVPIAPGSTVFELLQIRDMDRALNIVFVPDAAYGNQSVLANRQAFLDDLGNVVDTGYWENNAYFRNLFLTNFFYMTVTGTAAAPTSGICPVVTWPAQASTDAAFADLVLLVHKNPLRDCRWGKRATTEPTSFNTIVHESSHALFNLPDEYCCDGGYKSFPPVMYTSQSLCQNDPDNAPWRNCTSFTATSGTTWWRSEDGTVCLMAGGGPTVLEMGQADWFVARKVLAALGTPSDPAVFAPTTWDRP